MAKHTIVWSQSVYLAIQTEGENLTEEEVAKLAAAAQADTSYLEAYTNSIPEAEGVDFDYDGAFEEIESGWIAEESDNE